VDVKDLPDDAFEMKIGEDDEMYYVICYQIDVTYLSASTKYELVYRGKNPSSILLVMFLNSLQRQAI
jgi:hypothetical protein